MISIFEYDTIVKYQVTATCKEPLYIGSAIGERAEVLVHPVDDMPFVQAASISGVFRNYYTKAYGEKAADELFGSQKIEQNGVSSGSKICFTDGHFLAKEQSVKLELRPRVKMDASTGTASDGSKFNMEYIGAGAQIQFSVYLYGSGYETVIEDIFSALDNQVIQLGGQKSNGCGYMNIDRLLYRSFNMRNEKDRALWCKEEELPEIEYEERKQLLQKNSQYQNAYEIVITGQTEGEMLIKSAVVSDYGKDAPDCMNMRNSKKEYIVPGSSFKGTIRSQMEMIAEYMGVSDIIGDTFGIAQNGEEEGKVGNIRFSDTIIGEIEQNDKMSVSHRIHIDKFTGGVMHRGLFSEKNVAGKLSFKIVIQNKNNPERTCGLLLMALRDLAIGTVNIGSGYSVGKGIIQVEQLHLKKCGTDNLDADIFFQGEKRIKDLQNIIDECIRAVRRN